MAQIDDPKLAFAYVRPACVMLTQEQTVQHVQQLNQQLKEVTDTALQQLQEYVLFPLRFALKTPGPKKENFIQVVLEGIEYVLRRTCVQSWELLRELFSELCLCLSSPANPGKPAPVSEELKAAVLHGLDALLHASYGDIVFLLYRPVMLPGLGAAISLLLALSEQERCRNVQGAALKCLLMLLFQCNCSEEHVTPERENSRLLGTAFACFLPGITQAITRVVTGDLKQGHLVTVRGLRVWYKTVGLVMADKYLSYIDLEEKSVPDLGKTGDLLVKRTKTWVKDTSGKLAILLKKIISCTSAHQHWKVRLEMISLSEYLLTHCQESLEDCVSPLLEALVGMVNDENPIIQDKCSAVLDSLSLKNQSGGNKAFTDILSENLHSLTTSLPRLMRTSDDQHKLFILNVFLGYLKILGPQVNVVLNSAAHLNRISKALVQVLELDVSDVRIVEERGSSLVDAETGPLEICNQRKHFLYFTDAKIYSSLQQICRLLGYYGNLYLLVDHFMDLYRESSIYRKQCALVFNEIITGAAGLGMNVTQEHDPVSQDDLKAAVISIIEEYVSLNNWHLLTKNEGCGQDEERHFAQSWVPSIANSVEGNQIQLPASTKSFTLQQLNSNIWQICIQLEGIGSFALAMGGHFQLLLMTVLYPVLEKVGDDTLLISQSALCATWDICRACGYSCLKELINMNTDYLLNDISLNLQRLTQFPHAPRVLAVMFCYTDASLLPLVEDVVQDVLAALDQNYDERASVFCAVLHSLMKALVRWFPAKMERGRPADSPETSSEDCVDVKQFLLDYHKLRKQAEGHLEDENDDGDPEVPSSVPEADVDESSPDMKPDLPTHISMAKAVMERCIHLMSDPSVSLRLKVLDVVELCVRVLSAEENELLPLAHRCWPALLHRLTENDPRALLRAFRVLCILGETCGDFLKRRVSKDVLPRLTASLLKQAPVSARAGPIYTHTLAYKLQLAVLEGLGSLCLSLELADADLELVSQACVAYLSCRQPIRLQEACLSVFRHLMQADPDAVWFTLNELYCPRSYEPRHSELHVVHLSGTGQSRNEHTANVLKLLGEIR